jgi:hypothetical protein
MYQSRQKYLRVLLAVLNIQMWYREVREKQRMQMAVCVIEQFYLSTIQRRQAQRLENAAVVFQKTYRAAKQRERYITLKRATVVIQTWFRSVLAREKESMVEAQNECLVIHDSLLVFQEPRKVPLSTDAECKACDQEITKTSVEEVDIQVTPSNLHVAVSCFQARDNTERYAS